MSKLSYLARVMSGVRLKKMNQMIDVVHDKCGQNKVKTFFDMCWCGARYGAGYYDYVMFGFYNMNGRQRDTYLTGPLLVLNPPFTKQLLQDLGAEGTLAFEEAAMEAYEARLAEFRDEKRSYLY